MKVGDLKAALDGIGNETEVVVVVVGGHYYNNPAVKYREVDYSAGPGTPIQTSRTELVIEVA